jgi:hypothetical protein
MHVRRRGIFQKSLDKRGQKMKDVTLKPLWIVGWCFWLLAACQSATISQSTATADLTTRTRMVVSPTATIEEAPVLTPTILLEVTNTSTSTPIPTPTPSPSVTVTPSLLPTLPPDEALATVFMLFETNGGCLLPCWWGFTPGQTDWLTAKEFLSPFADAIYEPVEPPLNPTWSIEIHLPSADYSTIGVIHNYLIEEDIIQAFEVHVSESTLLFTTASILNTYGLPEEIYLRSGQYETYILMTFFYPQSGFRITYQVDGGTNENGVISACFQEGFPNLTVWSLERELSFIETYALFRREANGEYQIPLNIAAGMETQTFYETFSDPDVPICLETPTDIWPGY